MAMSSSDIGEVTAADAFADLQSSDNAKLVDVRTRAEWSFVGLPDLSGVGAEPVLLEWQSFPDMALNTRFADTLETACPDKSTALYFLCRSGARSLAAAREMKARGYDNVFNVVDGFEGPPDSGGRRGTVAGWKASGLPWRQS